MRGGFNLHTGNISLGCLSIPSDVDSNSPNYPTIEEFDRLKSLLDRTKPYIHNGSSYRGVLLSFKKLITCALAVFLCIPAAASQPNAVSQKVVLLANLNQTLAKLGQLAAECGRGGCDSKGELDLIAIERNVQQIVGDSGDSEFLFRVAAICYVSAYPQTAGMERVDVVFDAGWNHALRRLAALRDEKSLAALKSLDHILHTQGGEKLALQSLIDQTERSLSKTHK